jgi:hypothetical protein
VLPALGLAGRVRPNRIRPVVTPIITLKSAAYVTGEAIRLSDLLPEAAPEELRDASQGIDLGRAPQLGSMRVYEAAHIVEILNSHPEVARQITVPDQVAVSRSGNRLKTEVLQNAIKTFLRDKDAEDLPDSALRWSRDITTSEPNPALEVRSVTWDSTRRFLQFSMRCVKAAECRDFLVYLELPERTLTHVSQKLGLNTSAAAKPSGVAGESGNGPVLIQAGRKVQLIMKGDGIQISLPVICLQNGRAGEKIRVRDAGSARVFLAEVVSRDLLSSKLES